MDSGYENYKFVIQRINCLLYSSDRSFNSDL